MLKVEINLPQARVIVSALGSMPYKEVSSLMKKFEDYIQGFELLQSSVIPTAESLGQNIAIKRGPGRPRGSKNRKTSKKAAA